MNEIKTITDEIKFYKCGRCNIYRLPNTFLNTKGRQLKTCSICRTYATESRLRNKKPKESPKVEEAKAKVEESAFSIFTRLQKQPEMPKIFSMIARSIKKAFKKYLDNYNKKDLTTETKTYIKTLIDLWNNYKIAYNELIDYQKRMTNTGSKISDPLFKQYTLKYALLMMLYTKYGNIGISVKDMKKYIKLTNKYCDDYYTKIPTNSFQCEDLIYRFIGQPFMNM
jgi:hypothetical protein